MRTITFCLSLLFSAITIKAQTYYYNEVKTFVEDGYAYQCDLEGIMVTLYNKDYKDVYTKQERVSSGEEFELKANEDNKITVPDPEGRFLLTDVPLQIEKKEPYPIEEDFICTLFSEEEKQRIKDYSLGIVLHINPNSGKIDGVIFNFLNDQPFATIPVSTYRNIELKLKETMTYTPTAYGTRQNSLFHGWVRIVE